MKTIFLAWQAASSAKDPNIARAWFPIGRLDVDASRTLYTFRYTGGALTAQQLAGFSPLDAFPQLQEVYKSGDMFPLFQNRVLSQRRPDYQQFLRRMAIDPSHVDPLDILAISEGRRETDHLEVFPKIQPQSDGRFTCRFFLHGWRHVNPLARSRIGQLNEGDLLRVAVELNNPVTGAAIQLETCDDYVMLGWAPRYFVGDLLSAMAQSHKDICAKIIKVNPEPSPNNQRVLIELSGVLPQGVEPMSSKDYQPLVVDCSVH